jgi:MFS family permease
MLSLHVDAFWMPAATGALFFPLLFLSVWVLAQIPPPTPADEAERVRRAPMTGEQRRAMLIAYAPPLVLLVITYVMLTAFRDFRDNFAAEIWQGLGYGSESGVFTASELPVAILALGGLAAIIFVKDNRRALMVMHGVIFAGAAILGLSTLAFQAHLIGPLTWMIATGAGVYLGYTPFNAMLFDRLIAFSGRVATAGFLIYVADAAGYLGSVALLLWRNLGGAQLNWLQVFTLAAYGASLAGMVLVPLAAGLLFRTRRAEACIGPAAVAQDAGE